MTDGYFDYMLKFADEVEAESVLFDVQVIQHEDSEERQLIPKYATIDVVGVVSVPTGNILTIDGVDVPEMSTVNGWHVNVRHTGIAPELEVYQVFPVTPSRIWA